MITSPRPRTLGRVSLVVTAAGLAACTPLYYPPPAVAPLFADEGEVSITARGGTDGISADVAVAATSHVVIVAGTSMFPGDVEYQYGGYAGGGYFLPFGIGRFEAMGGVGGGTARGFLSPSCFSGTCGEQPDIVLSGAFVRPWAQATIGLSTDVFDGALVNRFSFVSLGLDASSTERGTVDGFFYEPTVVLRLGYRAIKAELQGGVSAPIAQTAGRLIDHVPFHVSLGLRVSLDMWGEGEVHGPGSTEE